MGSVIFLTTTAVPFCYNKRLLYETDSQTGFYSVMGMKGNASTFPVVKEFRLLCASRDVELEVVWRPR